MTAVLPRRRLAALPAAPRYLAGRIGQALLALFGVVTIVFFALRLSGDPARLLVPQGATAADIARVRARLGLDDSLWHQYTTFLGHAVRGDLGYSYVQNRPATDLLAERLPYTANLAVAALVLSLLFGVAVIMRVVDSVLSVPFFLLAILVVAVLGPSLVNVVVCLALVRWPRYARVAYSTTLQTRGSGFARAATATGAPGRWIVVRHVLPEVLPVAIVVGTLEFGLMVVYEASLSFLGLGVQPPTASWGSILSDGQQYIATAWWLATFPGLALFVLVLAVNLLGDAARDRLDPAKRAAVTRRRLLRRAEPAEAAA